MVFETLTVREEGAVLFAEIAAPMTGSFTENEPKDRVALGRREPHEYQYRFSSSQLSMSPSLWFAYARRNIVLEESQCILYGNFGNPESLQPPR